MTAPQSHQMFMGVADDFAKVKGTLQVAVNSVLNPTVATGSVVVAVGDLIVATFAEQTALTVTAVTDNLGNTYTAQNAGLDAGTVSGRAFYSRVTAGGTLTQVNFAATASANNAVGLAVGYAGPFLAPPIDANPALVEDITSPFASPATGTLTSVPSLVVGWCCNGAAGAWAPAVPMLEQIELVTQAVLTSRIGSWRVDVTTTVTPGWTGTNPTDSVLGTMSFRKG